MLPLLNVPFLYVNIESIKRLEGIQEMLEEAGWRTSTLGCPDSLRQKEDVKNHPGEAG